MKSAIALRHRGPTTFVLILGQGRSGSTLLLRLLNQVTGVRICGENYRALDHLWQFAQCYASGAKNRTTAFYSLAWLPPCEQREIIDHLRHLVFEIHGPGRIVGFKEIRYGRERYDQFAAFLDWLRELLPGLRIIFNVRATNSCRRSGWWARDKARSTAILNSMRRRFRRYFRDHPDYCYWIRYEELCPGSPALRGMFEFLGIRWRSAYERPLEIHLR